MHSALRTANNILANTPRADADGQAPIELFSAGTAAASLRHYHPFRCPVYVLNDRMQSGIMGLKWEECARVGIYLGNSPIHVHNVALVLNTETGLVSPQFLVQFDDLFKTVKSAWVRIHWHKVTGFVQEESKETSQQPPIPDAYYLPQCEPDSTIASLHDNETGMTNDDSTLILPQGKMGSTMDAQSISSKHMNIGSDNEHILNHQLAAGPNNANAK